MGTLDWQSDNLVVMAGPVVAETGLPPSETPDGGVSAKLYDTSLDCRLSEYTSDLAIDYVDPETSVFVLDSGAFSASGVVLIRLDDGTWVEQTLNLRSVATGELGWAGPLGLPGPASKGNPVRVKTYASVTETIGIDDFSQWDDGMNMEIKRDDGTYIERTVSAILPDAGYLTLDDDLDGDSSPGNIVKRKIGADVTMVAFGTFPTSDPTPGDPEWGFRGTIDHDHAELQPGMRIRAEITYEDGSVNIRRKVVGTVINR
jgi:hypothetical protein